MKEEAARQLLDFMRFEVNEAAVGHLTRAGAIGAFLRGSLARSLLDDASSRVLLGPARLGKAADLLVQALIRFGRYDEAAAHIQAGATATTPTLLDVHRVGNPIEALRIASHLHGEGRLSLRLELLHAELLQEAGDLGAALAVIDALVPTTREEAAEVRIARANVLTRNHQGEAAQAEIIGYFGHYDLPPPSLSDGEKTFRLGAIQNTHRVPGENGPCVTIAMTCFNAEQTVAHAVGSLLAQTHSNFELIIVDDA